MLKRIALAVALGSVGLACGESSSSPDGGKKDAGSTSGDSSGSLGGFSVQLKQEQNPFASIDGKVTDGPTPPLIQWDIKSTSGDCVLRTPKSILCDPQCAAGTHVCVAANVCQANPKGISVGEVSVTGVRPAAGESAFVLPETDKHYYYYAGDLAFPPFAEGDLVKVSAAGGSLGPFTLEARGVAPLAVTTGEDLVVSGTSDLTLTWGAAKASTSKMSVLVDLTHHGGTKAQVVCETADDGSLVIPKAMVSALLDYGSTGYPWIVLTRRATGTKALPAGVVSLELSSESSMIVRVPGVTSCTEPKDCASGLCKLPERVCQ